jgi:hypothetical protein
MLFSLSLKREVGRRWSGGLLEVQRLDGLTTRKCQNCPAHEAPASLGRSALRAVTRVSRRPEAAKASVYRKALFRDRNRTIKRALFTLERPPDGPRVIFQRSSGANSASGNLELGKPCAGKRHARFDEGRETHGPWPTWPLTPWSPAYSTCPQARPDSR